MAFDSLSSLFFLIEKIMFNLILYFFEPTGSLYVYIVTIIELQIFLSKREKERVNMLLKWIR
jgi:hypothetical protein